MSSMVIPIEPPITLPRDLEELTRRQERLEERVEIIEARIAAIQGDDAEDSR